MKWCALRGTVHHKLQNAVLELFADAACRAISEGPRQSVEHPCGVATGSAEQHVVNEMEDAMVWQVCHRVADNLPEDAGEAFEPMDDDEILNLVGQELQQGCSCVRVLVEVRHERHGSARKPR